MTTSPHLPYRPDWLRLHSEPILDPAQRIIDSHHHLWDHAANLYLEADFAADAQAGHAVLASVFVQCRMRYALGQPPELQSLGETEYVSSVAARAEATDGVKTAAAIVGHVDLLAGNAARAVLELHLERSGGRLRSIRNTSAWHDDPSARYSIMTPPIGLLGLPEFRSGFAELAPLRLAFDAWMYHTQLDELASLAGAFPGTTIILNHCGAPLGLGPYAGRRAEVFKEWRAGMARLVRYPNICVKVGGLGMRLFGFDFHTRATPPTSADLAEAWGPYVETIIELFGASRCMFESNFPVDRGTCSYDTLWNAYKRITQGCSAAERDALFFGAAAQAYSIAL